MCIRDRYKDESSRLYIPAHITEEQLATVRQDAVRVYTALGCRGLSRVDFFVTHDSGEVVFNELNAIPGFTSVSYTHLDVYKRQNRESGDSGRHLG